MIYTDLNTVAILGKEGQELGAPPTSALLFLKIKKDLK